jgi:hypothetical protein
VRVEEGDGTLVDQAEVAAASVIQGEPNQVVLDAATVIQGLPTWVTAVFPVDHVLNAGVAYHLVLESPAGTTYSAFPIRKGLDKGFSTSTVFPDGHAEFNRGGAAAWQGWDMWGTPDLTTADLQFAFVP